MRFYLVSGEANDKHGLTFRQTENVLCGLIRNIWRACMATKMHFHIRR